MGPFLRVDRHLVPAPIAHRPVPLVAPLHPALEPLLARMRHHVVGERGAGFKHFAAHLARNGGRPVLQQLVAGQMLLTVELPPAQLAEEHVHHLEETLSSQTMEESIVRTSTLQGESKELELNESPRRQDNFFSIGMKDISMKTAIYATNVAMELECLPLRQRIFAQKLIADVMFHAKLDNLTEYAMILGKVNRPFDV